MNCDFGLSLLIKIWLELGYIDCVGYSARQRGKHTLLGADLAAS